MHLSLQIDRRVALHGIMALLGATAVAGCGYLPGSDARTTLTEGQLKLLDLMADTIIPATDTPGAVEAGVPKRLAAMYTDWASDETREALSGALDRIEQAARASTGKDFAALSPDERLAFLRDHEAAALKPVPPRTGAPKGTFIAPVVSVADVGYHTLKQLIVGLYFSSEIGLTQELVYEHVPGPWQPSIAVTPGMRPFATLGPF